MVFRSGPSPRGALLIPRCFQSTVELHSQVSFCVNVIVVGLNIVFIMDAWVFGYLLHFPDIGKKDGSTIQSMDDCFSQWSLSAHPPWRLFASTTTGVRRCNDWQSVRQRTNQEPIDASPGSPAAFFCSCAGFVGKCDSCVRI